MPTDVNADGRLHADSRAMVKMLDLVWQVNEDLLEALVSSATSHAERCPLGEPIRTWLLELTAEERAQVARCGVLLGDVGVAHLQAPLPQNPAVGLSSSGLQGSHWLPPDQAITLTHSILLVGWHMVQVSMGLGCVTFGMSARSARAYSRLSIRDLARLAQRPACWVQPRWHDRPLFWKDLMQLVQAQVPSQICSVTVRCLQMSAGMVAT